MPNGRNHKSYDDYGPHEYADHDGTSDCQHGCGCWVGPARSGGPTGISPFGHCPNNPLDNQKQSGNNDYEDCVNGRIQKLESELHKAKQFVRLVEQARKRTKIDLIKRLEQAENRVANLKDILKAIQNYAERIQESALTIVEREE